VLGSIVGILDGNIKHSFVMYRGMLASVKFDLLIKFNKQKEICNLKQQTGGESKP